MQPTTTPNPRKQRWGWLVFALLTISIVGIAEFSGGCAKDTRYKVLSTFFDGVPDPNAPVVAHSDSEDITVNPNGVKVVGYTHRPFKENKCNACHENATGTDFASFTPLQSSICLKCHEKVRNQYTIMHGSVAAGECLFCHNPHESTQPALLNRPAPAVCVQCHLPENLSLRHADYPKDRSCLECHVGHGGEKHGLLRAGIVIAPTAPAPTTAPTSVSINAKPAVAEGGVVR